MENVKNEESEKEQKIAKEKISQGMQTIDAYKDAVEYLASNRINHLIFNAGHEHALIIFKNIFQSSRDCLRIFAGNLHNEVTLDKEYLKSLEYFLSVKKGKVKIILDRYDNNLIHHELFHLLKKFENNVRIKKTDKKYKIVSINKSSGKEEKTDIHFTVGDDLMYRLETDIDKRIASCNFNDPYYSGILIKKFDDLFDSSFSQVIPWEGLIAQEN